MGLKINGEPIQVAAGQPADPTYEFELDGKQSVALLLTDLSQEAPAGRYRLMVVDDEMRFERASATDLSTFETFITINKHGVVIAQGQTLESLLAILLSEIQELNLVTELAGA